MVIVIPESALVVLIGAAGSGKSTLAARLFAPEAVLSSDAYRAIVAGDAADQSATRPAFRALHRDLHRRLAEGRTTVVDATSVTPDARRALVRIAVAHGRPAIALVLDLDPALVQARNATRPGRIVPAAAVAEQLAALERSLRRGPLVSEGFATVIHLRTPAEVDELTLVRPVR